MSLVHRWCSQSQLASCFLIVFLLIFGSVGDLFAQEGKGRLDAILKRASQPSKYLSPHLFNKMSEKFALKPNDLRLRALFDPEDAKKLQKQREKEQASKTKSKDNGKLLFHLVKSKGGDEIVSDKALKKKIKDKIARKLPTLKERAQKAFDKQTTLAKAKLKLEKLPKCKKDSTERTETPGIPEQFREKHSHDVLIVSPKYDTQSAEDLFGENIQLIVYDTSKPNSLGFIAKGLQATCLPFRVRSTGEFLYQHQGEHAVRNYDGDPHGEGESLL